MNERAGKGRRAMTIGQLAGAAEVNVETIRYYQRRGLVATPSRPIGGQRQYPEHALRRLEFIRRAQGLGFTLEEIAGLLAISEQRGCARGHAMAQSKIEELGRRAAEIARMRRRLRALGKLCDANEGGSCPLIRELNGERD